MVEAPLKILISAYACAPGQGSEPEVGWSVIREVSRRDDVWLVTRANNRADIESELARVPMPRLRVEYYDLPAPLRFWKRGARGLQLYYYLWQLGVFPLVRRLHSSVRFDVVHHATFCRYWGPTLLPLLDAPFVWGPLGGGEDMPLSFREEMTARGRLYERVRDLGRRVGERDPFVRRAARRAAIVLAVTPETSARLRSIGAARIELFSAVALSSPDYAALARVGPPAPHPIRFLSVGRLLQWKGFHLGLRAFAAAGMRGCEYWVLGSGPEEDHLKRLAAELEISDRVRFLGALPRPDALGIMAKCHVLVHPSLHESGGWVCIEAMACGRPVLCFDLGGPAELVGDLAGIRITAGEPGETMAALGAAMRRLAEQPDLRLRLGHAGMRRVAERYLWEAKGHVLSTFYREIAPVPLRRRETAS